MPMSLQGNGRKIAFSALFTAIALILSYVESIVGLKFALMPWLKIGLANIVISFAFFAMSPFCAGMISVCRIIISGLLFGGPASMLYSLCGGVLSFLGLFVAKKLGKKISFIGAGVLCAALHNIGQMIVCAVFFGLAVASFYLPYLLLSGAVFGTVTGILLNFIMKKYRRLLLK